MRGILVFLLSGEENLVYLTFHRDRIWLYHPFVCKALNSLNKSAEKCISSYKTESGHMLERVIKLQSKKGEREVGRQEGRKGERKEGKEKRRKERRKEKGKEKSSFRLPCCVSVCLFRIWMQAGSCGQIK